MFSPVSSHCQNANRNWTRFFTLKLPLDWYGRTVRMSFFYQVRSVKLFRILRKHGLYVRTCWLGVLLFFCSSVNSHFSFVKTNLHDAQNEITFSRYEISNSASKDTKKTP